MGEEPTIVGGSGVAGSVVLGELFDRGERVCGRPSPSRIGEDGISFCASGAELSCGFVEGTGTGSAAATLGVSVGVCSCIFSPITAPHRHRNVQLMAIPILCSSFMRVLLRSDGLRQLTSRDRKGAVQTLAP